MNSIKNTLDDYYKKGYELKVKTNGFLPTQKRKGDAGYDFYLPEDIVIKPRQQVVIDTTVALELPEGHAGLFALRSSICNKYKHLILKNPLVDENYRGVCHVILYNDSFIKTIKFKQNERVVSLFVFPVCQAEVKLVDNLSESNRGSSWNGSSGM